MIGQTINNYFIERKLGEGGMSEVFFARHNRIERAVAIKVLHKNLFSNELVRNRFKNEANALIKLEHPNILKIYDYVEQEDLACLIVEYVDGITLDTFINKYSGPLPDAKAISLLGSVLDAVQYAHDNNILHRDIKPGNIMISRDSRSVKVMDFGIAKFNDNLSQKVTHLNAQLGTPYYMSPEQVKGLVYTALSDIYSLGVTLFEMATGKCPYIGISTLFELHTKIVNDPLPPTSMYYPNVSATLQEAIKIATNKTPQQRFKSCMEFKEFLQKENANLTGGEPSDQFYVTQRQALQKTMILQEEKTKVKTQNKKFIWAAIGAIIIIGAVIAGSIFKNPRVDSNYSIANKDSLIKNNKDSAGVKPEVNDLLLSKKADSLIASREAITNSTLKDAKKKAELKAKLISALTNDPATDSSTGIINNYSKYFLPVQTTTPTTTPITNLITPPVRSVVIADLTNNKLSNGITYSGAAVIENYSADEYNGKNPPEKWSAQITFKRNDTGYMVTVYYQKEGNVYKYSSNICTVVSVPQEVKTDPVPTAAAIRNDLIRHFNKEKKICSVRFSSEAEISDIKIGAKKEDAYSNITFPVDFSFKGQLFSATIYYELKHEDNNISKPVYIFNNLRIKC